MKYLVLDSNILLHYRSIEDIPWKEEIGCGEITIVLTAMVLEEIDKKKDQEKGKIQKRAKAVASRIGEILIDDKTSKYPVVFMESAYATEYERRQYHLNSNDNQILFDVMKSNLDLKDVVMVSSDNPMLVRAKQRGLNFFKLDDKYRLKEELSKEEKEAQAAITELARLKNRLPEPKLIFEDGGNHIQIKRVVAYDIEEEVKVRMKETSEPLTHTLLHEVFSFYVDTATCPNFGLKWYIADAALAEPVLGELNVSFIEE